MEVSAITVMVMVLQGRSVSNNMLYNGNLYGSYISIKLEKIKLKKEVLVGVTW